MLRKIHSGERKTVEGDYMKIKKVICVINLLLASNAKPLKKKMRKELDSINCCVSATLAPCIEIIKRKGETMFINSVSVSLPFNLSTKAWHNYTLPETHQSFSRRNEHRVFVVPPTFYLNGRQ